MSRRVASTEFDDCPGFYARPIPEMLVGGRPPVVLCSEARYAAEAGLAPPWQQWPAKLWAALGFYVGESNAKLRDGMETQRTGLRSVATVEDGPGVRRERRVIRFQSGE